MKTTTAILASVTVTALSAGLLVAGPLAPPAGPVASSYKTLADVEPRIAINGVNTPGDANCLYKITVPGSYYLTEQTGAPPAKNAIEVYADNVTIDLNGFRIGGYPGAYNGVAVYSNHGGNFTIHNGMIGPFDGAGLWLNGLGSDLERPQVYDLTISDCKFYGIRAARHAHIRDVTVSNCETGIMAIAGGLIQDCIVEGCDYGIGAGPRSTVERCGVHNNAKRGIGAESHSVIRQNTCTSNGPFDGGVGILAFSGTGLRLEDNHCSLNGVGIQTNSGGAVVFRNTCSENQTAWMFAPGTVHGPILDRTAPGSPGVNGSAAPDASGSAHPNANFTH